MHLSGPLHQPRNLLFRYVTEQIRRGESGIPSRILSGKRAQRVTSSDRFSPEDFDQPTLSGPAGQRTLGQALDEHDAAATLIERAYGRKADKTYFMGSSEGGREALTMAQRYPEDFDGIFARVPVINWTGLQHAGARSGLVTMGDGWIRPGQVKLVHDAVLSACGAVAGIVDDAVGCKAKSIRRPSPALPERAATIA